MVVVLSLLTFIPARALKANAVESCSGSEIPVSVPSGNFLVVSPEGTEPDWSITKRGPYATNIPAGTYDIAYVSYDDHSVHGGQNQQFEQWYIEGYANGVKVYTSTSTTDVPEDSDYLVGSFDRAVMPAIDSIVIRHVLDHNLAPQSVEAVCVGFTAIPITGGGGLGGEDTTKKITKSPVASTIGQVAGTTTVDTLSETGQILNSTLILAVLVSSVAGVVATSNKYQ